MHRKYTTKIVIHLACFVLFGILTLLSMVSLSKYINFVHPRKTGHLEKIDTPFDEMSASTHSRPMFDYCAGDVSYIDVKRPYPDETVIFVLFSHNMLHCTKIKQSNIHHQIYYHNFKEHHHYQHQREQISFCVVHTYSLTLIK